jgi:hypothetical protein
MTIVDIITNTPSGQAVLVRSRGKNDSGEWQYDVKELFTGRKKGWTILDSFSQSAIRAVYNAINDANKAKFNNLSLPVLVDFAFKHVN